MKSGPHLTITQSPFPAADIPACVQPEKPAAVILLISQAEAAVPVCLISLWVLASHVWLDECRVELPSHMCSVWVFAPEPMPLVISGGDWLVTLLLERTLKCRVNDRVRVHKEHKLTKALVGC